MPTLAEKIRKAREFEREFTAGGETWRLRLRRPTDAEAVVIMRRENLDFLHVAKRFVIGWRDVTEAKLVPSGASETLAFDAEAWAEIIADQPLLWQPVAEAVVASWVEHNERREGREKN